MADRLPLLVFPRARTIAPPKGHGGGAPKPHVPSHERQAGRLRQQLTQLERDFERYKASVSGAVAGLEPETVLVIEIAGSVVDFKQAIDATGGLEWLGEWDVEDIEPDDDFYEPPKIGVNFFKQHMDEVTEKELSKEIRNLLQEQGFIDGFGILVADDLSRVELPEHLEGFRQQIISAVMPQRGNCFPESYSFQWVTSKALTDC